jgi:DNA-binding MarR family transcriptional regulator
VTRWLDEDEQRAWRAFIGTFHRVAAAAAEGLAADGLSEADHTLLVPLSEAPHERLRARDLAQLACWDKSRLSKHVRRMETRGLVERSECDTDARGSIIELTAAGRAAIERATPRHVQIVRQVFIDKLSHEDLTALQAIGKKVLDPPSA